MAYKRSPYPMHKGTASHKSALKQVKKEFGTSVSGFDETKAYQKRHEQLLNQGFTPEDADRMIKDKAVTGEVKQKFPHDKEKPKTEKSPAKGSRKYDRKIRKAAKKIRKAQKHSGFSDVAVKEDVRSELSPLKQKVDPDAPGTPGQPGYEPPVRYDELDEKGKKLWHKVRGTKYVPEEKKTEEPEKKEPKKK